MVVRVVVFLLTGSCSSSSSWSVIEPNPFGSTSTSSIRSGTVILTRWFSLLGIVVVIVVDIENLM